MMGGKVHQLSSRKSALYVYRGEENKVLICQMYSGESTELPRGAGLRENRGIRLYIYRTKGVTMAFWREGGMICVLASDIDSEQLVQFAFTKAMNTPGLSANWQLLAAALG